MKYNAQSQRLSTAADLTTQFANEMISKESYNTAMAKLFFSTKNMSLRKFTRKITHIATQRLNHG